MSIALPVRRAAFAVLAGALCLLELPSKAAADPESERQAAVWEQRHVTVRLRNLSKRYSCKDLEEKFRDVLERLGARSLEIRASRCEEALGPAARSPRIRVEYEQLGTIKGTATRSQDIEATSMTVRIAPGDPVSLEESDCKLLKQMLDLLPGKPIKFNLACMVRPVGVSFYIVMNVLVPALPEPTHAVVASDKDR